MKAARARERFTGRIAGIGSTSGVRIVVGRWNDSPWGSLADVMVEDTADSWQVSTYLCAATPDISEKEVIRPPLVSTQ